MLFGDKEGFNRIYNEAGQPLFRKNEQVSCEKEGTWKGFHMKKGFKYVNQYKTYRGTFYVTDYRLIFLGPQKPMGRRAIVAVSGIGKVANVGKFQAARKKLSEYREFFEVKYHEIRKISSNPIAVEIFVKDMKNKYKITISKECEDELMLEYYSYKKSK